MKKGADQGDRSQRPNVGGQKKKWGGEKLQVRAKPKMRNFWTTSHEGKK